MFRDTKRKRLRNRVICAALGVTVLTFGIWLNYQDGPAEDAPKETVQEAAVEETVGENEGKQAGKAEASSVEEPSDSDDSQKDTSPDEVVPAVDENEEGTGTESIPETYLIKEVEGVVKVFMCDEEGNKELYLITSIPFDLLSESDQQLFIDGVELETEEDLGKFLENFDS